MENKKNTVLLTVIAIVTLLLCIIGATFAYFQAQGGTSVNANVNVITNTTDNLSFFVGSPINFTINQENFGLGDGNQSGSTTARATLTANNATNNATANYYIYLDIANNDFVYTTEDNQAEMLLKITTPDGSELDTLGDYNYVTSGEETGFDITTASGLITIADNYEIVSTGTVTQEWKVEIIFVNLDSDQNENTGKSFSAELIIQKEPMTTSLGNFATYITNLYTEDGVNDLYLHDGSGTYGAQEAGDNSYRYVGANPNNYVCFGSDTASCPNDNLYRIIGVFGNQVKLIKATSYGDYAWDADDLNTWDETTKPDIYTTLNTTYYNTLESEWQNLIAESTWQVGGMAYSSTNTAKQYHDVEVGTGQSEYEETMKIGLMYVSDYGYAASPENWIKSLDYVDGTNDYSNSTNTDNNWLYSASYEWTISRCSVNANLAFRVGNTGLVYLDSVSTRNGVRPSFYLESSVEFSGGSGSSADPYRIP